MATSNTVTGKLFTAEQKAQLALESLCKHNASEICERVQITPNLLTRWENELTKNAASIFKQTDAAAERISAMERLIGRMLVDQELETVSPTSPPSRLRVTNGNGHAEPVM